jgi:hypothetical protein
MRPALHTQLCCIACCSEGDVDVTLCCVPSHVHHVIFELLKNSLNATVTTHGSSTGGHVPPVIVNIVKVRQRLSNLTCRDTISIMQQILWTLCAAIDAMK